MNISDLMDCDNPNKISFSEFLQAISSSNISDEQKVLILFLIERISELEDEIKALKK